VSQTFLIEWVGDEPREWSGQYGTFHDYKTKFADYDETVTVTKKPDSPPPKAGDQVYGHITVKEFKSKDGEDFEIHKFKSERNPDFQKLGPQSVQSNSPRASGSPPAGGQAADTPPDSAFWYAKDQRIGRQGFMQAVVASGAYTNDGPINSVDNYVAFVNKITDALIVSLDKRCPHPGAPKVVEPTPIELDTAESVQVDATNDDLMTKPPLPPRVENLQASAPVGDDDDIPF
jgi:hypothetical protein